MSGGQGRNRTTDTRIFKKLLPSHQLGHEPHARREGEPLGVAEVCEELAKSYVVATEFSAALTFTFTSYSAMPKI